MGGLSFDVGEEVDLPPLEGGMLQPSELAILLALTEVVEVQLTDKRREVLMTKIDGQQLTTTRGNTGQGREAEGGVRRRKRECWEGM